MTQNVDVPTTEVLDLRDSVTCARCGEQLAIWTYNGDLSTLVCAECVGVSAAPASAVSGRATTDSFAVIG